MWSCKTLKNRSKLWMEGSREISGEKLKGIGNLKLDEVFSPKFSQAWFLSKEKVFLLLQKIPNTSLPGFEIIVVCHQEADLRVGRDANTIYLKDSQSNDTSIHVSCFHSVSIHHRLGESYEYADKNVIGHTVCDTLTRNYQFVLVHFFKHIHAFQKTYKH